MLGGMQKDAPLRQGRIHDRQHGCVVVNHHEARLRLWRVQGTGKVAGVDGSIHAGFAGAQDLVDAVASGQQEQTFVGLDR